MTDEHFRKAAIDGGADPLPLLAYADWLEEQGVEPDLQYALRWMARRGKRPFLRERYRSGVAVAHPFRWAWYRLGTSRHPRDGTHGGHDPRPPLSAFLPRTVFAAITSAQRQFYPRWDVAVRVLAEALEEARVAAQT